MEHFFSILIPTKNRPDRLARAVQNILQQDQPLEIIIKGGPVGELPDDPRITVLGGTDTSIPNALNQAAAHARGDILHFACDDDRMEPGTLHNVLTHIDQGVGARWTYGVTRMLRHENANVTTVIGSNGGWPWDRVRLLRENYIPQPTVFFTHRAFEIAGPFDESLPLCHDYEFLGRLGARWDPSVRSHIDAEYTVWEGGLSVANRDEQVEQVRRLQARWEEIGLGFREKD